MAIHHFIIMADHVMPTDVYGQSALGIRGNYVSSIGATIVFALILSTYFLALDLTMSEIWIRRGGGISLLASNPPFQN